MTIKFIKLRTNFNDFLDQSLQSNSLPCVTPLTEGRLNVANFHVFGDEKKQNYACVLCVIPKAVCDSIVLTLKVLNF